MAMYNLSSQFYKFHENHVKLSNDEKIKLREYKSINLSRLDAGLEEINKEKNKSYKVIKNYEQGSMAMETLTQNESAEYDIDIAVIFDKDNIPSTSLDARKLVEDALRRKCTNFTVEPTARTNAVTVWYQDGYHVDFAVYRQYKDVWENQIIEHGGASWTERNPVDITEWFNKSVKDNSPKKEYGATVEPGQMRRIVRLLKMFCKSRASWSLPGGLILSVLVAEQYRPDSYRDDKAFYDTIVAIKNRLAVSCKVYNPVITTLELTSKNEHLRQVERLKSKLEDKIDLLDDLFTNGCAEATAKKAWKKFFNHDYWEPETTQNQLTETASFRSLGYSLDVKVLLYMNQTDQYPLYTFDYRKNKFPKGKHIRFEAIHSVPAPYVIKWEVVNVGDEASDANDMGHVQYTEGNVHWEHTAYRGDHKMICSIVKNGVTVAQKTCIINIS